MTIRIGELTTEIDSFDALVLRFMADRVANDRPSFRRVVGRVGDETVEIYTVRHEDGERLAVHGPSTRREFGHLECRALQEVLANPA